LTRAIGQCEEPSSKAPQRQRSDAFEEQIKSLIVDEAYRKTTVREGEKLVQLATIEAIIRSLSIAAAKGNSRAQRMFVDLLRWVEGDRRAARLKFSNELLDTNAIGRELSRSASARGRPGPNPFLIRMTSSSTFTRAR
jgi:hypothetical protein